MLLHAQAAARILLLVLLLAPGLARHHQQVERCLFDEIGVLTDRHVKIHIANLTGRATWGRAFSPQDRVPQYYAHCITQRPLGFHIRQDIWTTNQFCSGLWFHKQLTRSPLLVPSAADADVIYLPLHGLDLSETFINPGEEWKQAIKEFYESARDQLPFLGKKPHFMVLPRTENEYHGEMLHEKYEEISKHLTFLTIEINEKWMNANVSTLNRIAIPYPAIIHWTRQNIRSAVTMRQFAAPRLRLAYGSWHPKTHWRQLLLRQCLARRPQCEMFNVEHEEAFLREVERVAYLGKSSWFCLQPSGDTYSRRQMYSCLSTGAIPVTFDGKYQKLLPFSDVLNTSMMLVDMQQHDASLNSGQENIVDLLEKLPPFKVLAMQQYLWHHRQVYQYMLDPVHELVTIDTVHEMHCMEDAFTFSLKGLVRNSCNRGLMPPGRCPGAGARRNASSQAVGY